MTIPQTEGLSTSAMNRVFDTTTATYKFYWLLALLDMHVKEQKDEMLALDVAARMVAYAWYPTQYFRLSFGKGTGRQMVYALWTVRRDFVTNQPELFKTTYDKILQAFEFGIEHKKQAIESVLATKPFTFDELDKYLGGAIKWNLTADALEALKLYYHKAAALNLIDGEPKLEFANA